MRIPSASEGQNDKAVGSYIHRELRSNYLYTTKRLGAALLLWPLLMWWYCTPYVQWDCCVPVAIIRDAMMLYVLRTVISPQALKQKPICMYVARSTVIDLSSKRGITSYVQYYSTVFI